MSKKWNGGVPGRSWARKWNAAVLLVAVLSHVGEDVPAQEVTLKATAPELVAPVDGARLDGVPPAVTLVADAAVARFARADLDHRFEVFDGTAAMTRIVSAVVAGGRGAVYELDAQLEELRTYMWRVRAELDGAVGPWSAVWRFETGATPMGGTLRFTDVTIPSGVAVETGARLGGHGVAFADATGSGAPDLYITFQADGPAADEFFVNRGGGIFFEAGAARGIADFGVGSHGAAWGDLDNDGDFDLVNGATGEGAPNTVFRNDGGGRFTDATPPSVRRRREATRGVALFDMDRDGDLDIFTVSGWRGSADPAAERNELYRNDGQLRFTAVEGGAAASAPAGQGVTDSDFDGDGDVDLVAANVAGDLVILRNDGTGDFALVEPRGIGIVHRASSGVTTGDIDNDGDLDMLVVGADENGGPAGHLYGNDGTGVFAYLREFSGTTGYMGGFGDLDEDGDIDLVFAGDDVVYLNDGAGGFVAGPAVPVNGIRDPRAIAFADVDDDGDLDFAIGAKRSRNWLVRNEGRGAGWLKLLLRSPSGEVGAFGAKVGVYAAGRIGSPIAFRESRSANGYLGQNDPVLHVGIGEHARVDVVVSFLDGTTRVVAGVEANQAIEIDGATGGRAPVFIQRHR